ncbi:serine/threonine protein kinase [Chaetomium strumarium]|uniref:Serine/threonine protein kinase n=1 Tax=Chaetomium strumarium TaxID=1170767 RepID=A0AAJ0GTV7_9PEZI|nr:serine/threonine protein kinase [Chaetomium strumarium]
MSTSYVYHSVFSDSLPSIPTPSATATDSTSTTSNTLPGIATPPSSSQFGQEPSTAQGLASFICHVAYLDVRLQRGDSSAFFAFHGARVVNRKRIANGASFIVERAELEEPLERNDAAESTSLSSGAARQPSKPVVVKTVRENKNNRPSQWREVLLEIRALLHEPIRYHPNIVKFMGIRWDASIETGSPFPAIVQEHAAFGTLDKLQQRSKPLPFSIKQKLCYDVGRGLSIIHACGMVHGDLKHENVLIFPNRYPDPPNQPYTAKLADFGGTVMDMGSSHGDGHGQHRIPMYTFPYEAPEIADRLTEEGAKKTDAYSYGMLIWRCMIDSQDVLAAAGTTGSSAKSLSDPVQLRNTVQALKVSDGMLEAAIHSVAEYCFGHAIPRASFHLITSALMFTLRGDPQQRALDRAQVRLRGMDPVAAHHYVGVKDEANRQKAQRDRYQTPGRHGMDLDSVGYALGRLGSDYDAQNNLPGFRPDLPRPERGGFHFEPLRLRYMLGWAQQEAIVRDLEIFAEPSNSNSDSSSAEDDDAAGELTPSPWLAAFFLFQSYLCGFGVACDPRKACYWLRRAAEPPLEIGETDYYAMAWLNRIHAALGVLNPYSVDMQMDVLALSAMRGHRHCVEDAEALIDSSADPAQRHAWRQKMSDVDAVYKVLTGSTGMPFFAPRKLTRDWALGNLEMLDAQLRQELGREYESCLRPPRASEEASDPPPDDGYRFDRIYVNHKGHGLLHLAAVQGRLGALQYLHAKYLSDINLKNQSHGDTVLTLACRTGRFDMVMWCLENGADPNGADYCEESPLHCITAFSESEMDRIVARLVEAGADIEKHSEASRSDIRGIVADWEDSFSITLTPLGRAVLKQSLPAVRVLLKHGASPTLKRVYRNRANQSAVELAAVLTLPDILAELLRHTDDGDDVFDECEMLDAAHTSRITPYDSLSLHSRLVRCGVRYKDSLDRTLRILHERSNKKRLGHDNQPKHPAGKHLCEEIRLGNADIVSSLLRLGHSASGSPGFRPLVAAVQANNVEIFHLLLAHDPSLLTTTSSLDPDTSTSIGTSTSTSASLLHVLAQRPPHRPRDLAIASHLLSHTSNRSIPAYTVTPHQPSPLVLAILNGFYKLADLLVTQDKQAAASLSFCRRPAPRLSAPREYTLLGWLLRSQTSSSLRAIRYLSHLHTTPDNGISISPLAYRTREGVEVSALHALSEVPASEWNTHAQISASIIQQLLTMFPTVESLGQWAVNPLSGSVVSAAVVRSHAEVLRAVLAAPGYRGLWDQPVKVYLKFVKLVADEKTDEMEEEHEMRPIEIAREVARQKLLALGGSDEVDEEELEGIKRAAEIMEMLNALEQEDESDLARRPGDEVAADPDYTSRIEALEARLKPDFEEPPIDRDSQEVNMPVDLSVLTDERPTGWTEGAEMTAEMSLRIFLRHFRNENQLFGDAVVKAMSKMFNRREPEEGEEDGRKGT